MHPMLNIAIRAARAAGDIIVRQMDLVRDIAVHVKGKNDFVTEIDKNAEITIIQTIKKFYPDHAFIGEETGETGSNEHQWIIDPLDGTTNYLHGFPQFAVSIALRHKNQLQAGVIYDPLRQEMFTASRGHGAQLNNKRIRVSQRQALDGALLGTGYPCRQEELLDKYIDSFRIFCPLTAGIRRAGAASLDLAYLACGRLDGFWEYGLHIWDIAAGVLLIRESGGLVSGTDGKDDYMDTGNIVAANSKLLKIMLNKLNQ